MSVNGHIITALKDQRDELQEEVDRLKQKLTTARLGIEWRDDCLATFCDIWNDARLHPRRDKLMEKYYDKTNDFWEKEEKSLSLSPYTEEVLKSSDAYHLMDEHLHAELDRLGAPKEGMGSFLRIRAIDKARIAAEEKIKELEKQLQHQDESRIKLANSC